ncbi:Macro domain protein [compost metagenome]
MSKTISTVKGNIFAYLKPGDAMVHGCNAQGVMGSGVAAGVREIYPGAYDAYRSAYVRQANQLFMGTVIPYFDTTDKIWVLNAITQEYFGRDPDVRYVSYDAIEDSFKVIRNMAPNTNIERLLFPLIGAGLGNGTWSVIEEIIRSVFEHSNLPLILVKQ